MTRKLSFLSLQDMQILHQNLKQSVTDGRLIKTYSALHGYDHSVVIHKEEFVNKQGDHINSIESLWSQLKLCFFGIHGVKACNVDSYIKEFM